MSENQVHASAQDSVINKFCRIGTAHEAHTWTYQAYVDDLLAHGYEAPKRIDVTQIYSCPGTAHVDHADRCCTIHGTHTEGVHKGCILR